MQLDDNANALFRILGQEVAVYGVDSGPAERAWQDFEEAARECADNRGGLWFAGSAAIVLFSADAEPMVYGADGKAEQCDDVNAAVFALVAANTTLAPTDAAQMLAHSVAAAL